MKTDAAPILGAGLHHLTTYALKQVAVDAFPADTRRAELFGKLLAWRNELRAIGVSGVIWLDGSFMTAKHHPDDIDLILWSPKFSHQLTPVEKGIFSSLLNKPLCRAKYGLDVYSDSPTPDKELHAHAYWKGLFGFAHDGRTAKGIAEVVI